MKWIRKHYWAIGFSLVLIFFTGFVLLDTFVIEQRYQVVEKQEETEKTQEKTVTESTSTSYKDETVSIQLKEYRENETTIYVADITLENPTDLQTAFAQDTFGKNVTDTTSDIAKNNQAILAINGDFYGAQNSGYVIRNGVLYRDTMRSASQEDLVIYQDGSMKIIQEGDITAKQLIKDGALQVFSFGPGLISDGDVIVNSEDEVGKAMASNPRTAIGVIDANHYVMVVSDGRTQESEGLTLYQLANFMEGLGVKEAYNLDGGGSSTMVFNGEIVNQPVSNRSETGERSVSDIVYIGK